MLSTTPAYAGVPATCRSTFLTEVTLGIPLAPDVTGAWRSSITNPQVNGQAAVTSAAREQWIMDATSSQLTYLNRDTDTPEMSFAAAEGVRVTMAPEALALNNPNPILLSYPGVNGPQGRHYETEARLNISGLGPSGILNGTLLLPVSGHLGLQMSKQWAAADTYKVYFRQGQYDRTDARHSQLPTDVLVVNDAPSRGIITLQEVSVQMVPNQVYRLEYYRSGSGGPGGYSEGRVIELVWDGQ